MDETIWGSILPITDMIQAEPIYGSSPSKPIEIKIVYDDNFLYVSAYLFDDPSNIKRQSASYDDWYEGFENNSDYFVVEIDSNHDHHQSNCFAVNSAGVKADYIMYNDGVVDDDWNAASWDAKVSIVEDGWVIEYAIPLKILKYHNNSSMGINFIRFSHSDKQLHYWVLLPIEIDGTVSHYGHIHNLILSRSQSLVFNPYIVTGKTKFNNKYYGLINDELDYDLLMSETSPYYIDRLGFDIYYSSNNFFNLSYSHNPDFGQIEQNASDINFTSFEDFYIEKRSFFIDDSNVFFTPINIFYSQRVGSNIIYDNQLYNVSINDAFRINGASSNGFHYGLLIAQSEIDDNSDNFENIDIKNIAGRLKQKVINDNSHVGFISTFYKDFNNSSRVYAADGIFNFMNNKLKFDTQIASSSISDINDNGFAQSYEVSYTDIIRNSNNFLDNNIFDIWINYETYDEDFYINHTGYLQRNDYMFLNFGLAFTENNPNQFSIYRTFNIQFKETENMKSDRLNSSISFNWQNTFINNYFFGFSYLHTLPHYDDWLFLDYDYNYFINNNSPIIKKSESNEVQISFQTDPTYKLFLDYSLGYFQNKINDNGISYYINLNYKPIEWLSIDLDYKLDDYSDKYNLLKIRRYYPPDLGNTIREDEYLFSDSEIFKKQITLSLFTYFTNQFSIELFSRYFVYENDFSPNAPYYKLSDNYIYPDLEDEITNYENDRLLYGVDYSSLEFNCIFKWEFDRKINLYIIYSSFKGVNGMKFDNIAKFIEYEFDNDLSNPSEIFYDKSIFIKFDFLLNN